MQYLESCGYYRKLELKFILMMGSSILETRVSNELKMCVLKKRVYYEVFWKLENKSLRK